MECESLVVASLIDNVNSCKTVFDIKNTETVVQDSDGAIIEREVSKVKSSCLKKSKELKAPKKNSRQIERFKFTRSASSPVMVVENPTKNSTSNNEIKESNRENRMNHEWKKKGRNVSFDEYVHVLTKCSVIEMPLKNSMLENNESSTCCKCRKGILKHGEGNSVKKTVAFEQEELIRSAILNHDLSEFAEVCQQWEINFNKKLSNGLLTPLHLASIAGSFRIVQFILKHGGQVDEADELRWTPLHYAVLYDHIPCALLLLQAGADIGARTADHRTPIELASQDEMLLLLGRVMNGLSLKASLDQNKETYV
jgi:hypothetical protein